MTTLLNTVPKQKFEFSNSAPPTVSDYIAPIRPSVRIGFEKPDLSRIRIIDLVHNHRERIVERGIGATRRWVGWCPFCGDSGHDARKGPVNRFGIRSVGDKELFKCHRCGKGGDAVTFIMERDGVNFQEALSILGLSGKPIEIKRVVARQEPECRPLEFLDPPDANWQRSVLDVIRECEERLWSPSGAVALKYLRDRKLSDETIRKFRLGLNASNRHIADHRWISRGITIPRFYDNNLWAVNVRRSKADYERDGQKTMHVGGSRASVFFNGDSMFSDAHTLFVVGGEFDAMTGIQDSPGGVSFVTLGGESATPSEEIKLALGFKNVLVCLDNDDTGNKGALKWAWAGKRVVVPNGLKDLNDFAKAGGDVRGWIEETVLEYLSDLGCEPTLGASGEIKILAKRE